MTPTRLDLNSLALFLGALLIVACADGGGPSHQRGGLNNPYAGGATPTEAPCDDELTSFRNSVWTPVLAVQCAGCHTEGGPASDSGFVLTEVANDADLVANFHATARMAFTMTGSSPTLLLKPTNAHPSGHGGGELFEVGSLQYQALESFVQQVTTEGCDDGSGLSTCEEPVPGRRALRRLTHAEYQNTVRDLLGVETERPARFAADTVVDGFDNNSAALVVSPLLADQYSASADAIADEAMMYPDRFIPSCESGWTSERCAEHFIRTFGGRAFRRPVTDTDVSRYIRVYRLGAQGETFESGIRWTLVAMLQSPSFLYRREIGQWDAGAGLYRLDDYEVASELSYLILASMPDDALFDAAAEGELRTPEQILTQAQRLLALDSSRGAVRQFVRRWLDLERLHTVPKDSDTYPEFSEAGSTLRESMQGEIDRFVDHVVFESEGSLSELLTADYSFVNDELSTFYSVSPEGPADSEGYRRVSMTGEDRRGITTLGGYLATHARPNSSSPVERGLIVRERVLCQDLPPPPPGVVAEPPPPDPSSTTRERYSMHSTDDACRSCHRLIDPLGFPYEHFDGAGRWRMDDFGHPIDATGEISETENTDAEFDGHVELTEALSTSPDVHDCFTLQWVRYGYGVSENGRLSCMVDELAQGFRDGSMSIPELIAALTQTAHFVSREGDAPTDDAEPEPEPEDEAPGGGDPLGGDESSMGTGTTEPDPDIHVSIVTDSDWGDGYCKNVVVTNMGAADISWSVEIDVDGSLREGSPWNATASARAGRVTFRGVDWNGSLAPGGVAEFGFCAAR